MYPNAGCGAPPAAATGGGVRPLPDRFRLRVLRGALCRQVPIEDLASLPMDHSGMAGDVVVDGFEVFDAVRLARDVRVDRDRHDLGALPPLLVQPVEGVDATPGEVFRFVVLHE